MLSFPENYETYATIAVAIIFIVWIIYLEYRLRKLLIGKNSETIDDSLNTLKKRMDIMKAFKDDTENKIKQMDSRIKKSITGVDVVRFNPFKSAGGGNQSFAAAFLNESEDGAVISSLYSREHVSIFGKPIKKGSSSFELSEEEKMAITGAKKNISN